MSLVKKAELTYREECRVEAESSILVACSGGPDSVALLHFLFTSRQSLAIGKLGVYHLNHGLRGRAADRDETFVRNLARKLSLPFFCEKENVRAYASQHGISLEMAGRKLRYAGIDAILESEGFDYAALGHTSSDNAEWLLLSVVRGRAEPLLWGIPPRRERYIRPLIRCTRDEIMAYVESADIAYRRDSSNRSLAFDRNRLRNCIVPLLKELNPSLEETISRTLRLGDGVHRGLDIEAREAYTKLVAERGSRRELDTRRLSSYNPATQLRVLRLFASWLRGRDLLRIFPLTPREGTVEVARGDGERLLASYDRLVAEPVEGLSIWKSEELTPGSVVLIPDLGWRLILNKGEVGEFLRRGQDKGYDADHGRVENDVVYFDASTLDVPFTVRPWREGDRIVPFGRSESIKVKRVFSDRKVPRTLRKLWPLVCKNEEVLWVAGLVRSALAPVSSTTRRLWILTFIR